MMNPAGWRTGQLTSTLRRTGSQHDAGHGGRSERAAPRHDTKEPGVTVSRRSVLAGTAAAALAAGVAGTNPAAAQRIHRDAAGQDYLIGCGIGDITGAPAGQGMMGYAEQDQVTTGLLTRCWSRAYIIVDQVTGDRIAFVNTDNACLFQSVQLEVLRRLAGRFGNLYTERNVNLNATHNHNSCGGTAPCALTDPDTRRLSPAAGQVIDRGWQLSDDQDRRSDICEAQAATSHERQIEKRYSNQAPLKRHGASC